MKLDWLEGLDNFIAKNGGQGEMTALFTSLMFGMLGTPWYGLSLVVLGCLLPFGLIAFLLSWWLVAKRDRPSWKHFLLLPATTCMLLLGDMPKLLSAWRQDRSHQRRQKG